MEVNSYKWYVPEFKSYNQSQSKVIPFCDKDCNLVVCFPTAVGKTVIAEAAFAYHIANNQKCVYLAPLKALCEEKFQSWKENYFLSKANVSIRTGDMVSSEMKMDKSLLSVMTYESFAAMVRGNDDWIKDVGIVVIDEAHNIGIKNRGALIETMLMQFTRINRGSRIIMLSATMGNSIELARWIKSLNGKDTKHINSDWRPNKMEIQEVVISGWQDMKDKTLESIKRDADLRTIIFVHSKNFGNELVSFLRKNGVNCAFHNASASANKRDAIERAFSNENSRLKVIVATSTLSAGVNL